MRKKFLPLIASGLLALTAASCSGFNDDMESGDGLTTSGSQTALVTVCPESDGSFFMQLDDSTRLNPVNVKKSPFGEKEVRAILRYHNDKNYTAGDRVRDVKVNSLDSIRTKRPVAYTGESTNTMVGNDPIEIINDWVTVAEDGYLTLRLRTYWGNGGVIHDINLLTGTNPEDPFEVELRHNAHGDLNGTLGDALIAFYLGDIEALNNGPVQFTLKWRGFMEDKKIFFILRKNRSTQQINVEGALYSDLVK